MTDIMLDGVIRPCVVVHKINKKKVEKRAIFHRWTTNFVMSDRTQVVTALALIEYKDGTVAQVSVKNLRFLDTEERFSEYFREEEDEKSSEEQLQVQQV